jgi:glycosyltransferase involved in cell wall biosynthesis
MRNRNILVANHHLHKTGGTETYTYCIIEELLKRGFSVEYFTFHRGEMAAHVEKKLSVPFMSKKRYDVILANHNTCINYLFNKGFIIQTCHGIFPDLEQPSPNANAYVAISAEVKDHLEKNGYESKIIFNGINLNRYKSIKPISKPLERILSLCHSDEANNVLRAACNKIGAVLFTQDKYKNPVWEVEQRINMADLVVGVGRSAYEAMACGRPVVIFDHREYYPPCGDGYVKDIIEKSIYNNCSGRFSNKNYSAADMETELKKYDARDGDFFRKFAETNLDIKKAVDAYLNYYYEIKKRKPLFSLSYFKRIWLNRKLKKGLVQYFLPNDL